MYYRNLSNVSRKVVILRSIAVKINDISLIGKTKNDETCCVNTIVIALDAAAEMFTL